MRLSTTQTRLILDCVRAQFGADAQVRLFGSLPHPGGALPIS